jgi:hypothetical protein
VAENLLDFKHITVVSRKHWLTHRGGLADKRLKQADVEYVVKAGQSGGQLQTVGHSAHSGGDTKGSDKLRSQLPG